MGLDGSPYRQATFGDSALYCDVSLSCAGGALSGSGTYANPWNMNRALALAVAGDVVRCKSMGASVSSTPAQLTTTNHHQTPAFNPLNSGSGPADDQRIIFVTEYPALGLSYAGLPTDTLRTELRHNGTPMVAAGQTETGTACPLIGSNGAGYITFDGFFIDMAQAEIRADGGLFLAYLSAGLTFRNITIKGTTTNCQSNAALYRAHICADTIIENCYAQDFINDGTGSDDPQPGFLTVHYSDQNFMLRHNTTVGIVGGCLVKGGINPGSGIVYNHGIFEYNHFDGCASGLQFNGQSISPTNYVRARYCLISNYTGAGVFISNETGGSKNLDIHHITTHRAASVPDSTFTGPLVIRDVNDDATSSVYDCLFDGAVTTFDSLVDADYLTADSLPTLDNNVYYRAGSAGRWRYRGEPPDTTIAGWRAHPGSPAPDPNSVFTTVEPFVNRGVDFNLAVGHAARTASRTGGQVGCYAGSEVIGIDTGPLEPVGIPRKLTMRY